MPITLPKGVAWCLVFPSKRSSKLMTVIAVVGVCFLPIESLESLGAEVTNSVCRPFEIIECM